MFDRDENGRVKLIALNLMMASFIEKKWMDRIRIELTSLIDGSLIEIYQFIRDKFDIWRFDRDEFERCMIEIMSTDMSVS